MCKCISRHLFGCILLINAFFAFLFFLLYDVTFGNDDMVLCWIASGKFFGQPDSHLVFINFIYGYAISFLYRILPSIEWYSIMLIALQVVSFSIIQNGIIRIKCGKLGKAFAVIAVFFIEFNLLKSLTFTTTAGILATASFFLICERKKVFYLLGIVCFLVASFVRFSSAMLVGVIFVSFYPLYVYGRKFSKEEFVCLFLCVVLPVGFKFVDSLYYRMDDGWEKYYESNKARFEINDHVDVWRVNSDLPSNKYYRV